MSKSQNSKHIDNEEIIYNMDNVIPAPADTLLGVKYVYASNKKLIAEMAITPSHTQPMAILHGGISCVLAESVGSVLSNLLNANNVNGQITTAMVGLNLIAHHLKSAMIGDTVVATGTPVHAGKSTHLIDIQLTSKKHGYIICSARLTTHVMKLDMSKHKAKFLDGFTTDDNNNNNNGQKSRPVSTETASAKTTITAAAAATTTTQTLSNLKPTTPVTSLYPSLPNGQTPLPASL